MILTDSNSLINVSRLCPYRKLSNLFQKMKKPKNTSLPVHWSSTWFPLSPPKSCLFIPTPNSWSKLGRSLPTNWLKKSLTPWRSMTPNASSTGETQAESRSQLVISQICLHANTTSISRICSNMWQACRNNSCSPTKTNSTSFTCVNYLR